MIRLFVAIKIEPDAQFTKIYQELASALSYENLRFIAVDNLHLTLRFIGETAEERIASIDRMLKKSAGQAVPFSMKIQKTGVFGSSYQPRVVWFGVERHEQLIGLHTAIQLNLSKVGFYADRQNFVPHLTLTRIRQLKDLKLFQKIIGEFKELELMQQPVTSFSLIESILQKEGPIYNTLFTYPLEK